MKRILIGVLFVVSLGLAGYVGVVIGRVAEDTPLAPSPSVEELSISPPMGTMLVLPTVGRETVEVEQTANPTLQAFITVIDADTQNPPSPEPECEVMTVDLSYGQSFNIILTEEKSIWHLPGEGIPLTLSPMLEEEVTINGTVFEHFSLLPYTLYRLEPKDREPTEWLLPGSYHITLKYYESHMPGIGAALIEPYTIYICPPL